VIAGAASGERGTYPPYIHFTLQKTNRDTQDALAHFSRILHVNIKDLSVAGTKDKRGVTIQRVSLRRGNKTVEDVWKLANGQTGRKSNEEALLQRGERGVRIADLNYRKSSLELGMLKGNAFLITLRWVMKYQRLWHIHDFTSNVQVDSSEALDLALNTIKQKGFINYYGDCHSYSYQCRTERFSSKECSDSGLHLFRHIPSDLPCLNQIGTRPSP
jgi:tRNA pseudouridine13 synthase